MKRFLNSKYLLSNTAVFSVKHQLICFILNHWYNFRNVRQFQWCICNLKVKFAIKAKTKLGHQWQAVFFVKKYNIFNWKKNQTKLLENNVWMNLFTEDLHTTIKLTYFKYISKFSLNLLNCVLDVFGVYAWLRDRYLKCLKWLYFYYLDFNLAFAIPPI